MPPKPSRRRARWLAGTGAVMVVALLAPLGRYDPYPRTRLAMTEIADSCRALPGDAVSAIVGHPVATSAHVRPKPRAEIENLFPSISRSECAYRWPVRCARATTLRALTLTVIALPDRLQALTRFGYGRTFLRQDSRSENGFGDFSAKGRRAYEVTIGREVLERVLDRRYVLDMQAHLCGAVPAARAEAAVRPLVARLRLPVSVRRGPAARARHAG
jgi:hypothetical protein